MTAYQLYVLDYNYSSWSMRAGVLMRLVGADFSETQLHLDDAGKAELKRISPTGLAPLLVHGELKIWESLAIAEYLAEQFPDKPLWPRDREARALARAASCEMHAGFGALRQLLTCNIRAHYPGFARPPEVDSQVKRIEALWSELRQRFGRGGEYLCGEFGIVDAMFAPVVTRFRTYDVGLSGASAEYAAAVLRHPAVESWLEKVRADTKHVAAYDYVVG
jgi:glutathione S-transferase